MGSGAQGCELGECQGTTRSHLGAHEVHDGIEALAGSGGRGDRTLALVGGADRQDRVQARELARAAKISGHGSQLFLQACDAVAGAFGRAVARDDEVCVQAVAGRAPLVFGDEPVR